MQDQFELANILISMMNNDYDDQYRSLKLKLNRTRNTKSASKNFTMNKNMSLASLIQSIDFNQTKVEINNYNNFQTPGLSNSYGNFGSNLSPDLQTNVRQKHFKCPYQNCSKAYYKSSHLKAHIRVHTGDRPFICLWENCQRRFTRSDELSRHKRTHTGEKMFSCSLCSRKFNRSDHLTKHLKTHKNQSSVNNVPSNQLFILTV